MASRLQFQDKLEETLETRNVYYQPPENVRMNYPCVVYEQYTAYSPHANDKIYLYVVGYQVTVIDEDPESPWKQKLIEAFPMCQWNRHYVTDNLNHDVFIIYY